MQLLWIMHYFICAIIDCGLSFNSFNVTLLRPSFILSQLDSFYFRISFNGDSIILPPFLLSIRFSIAFPFSSVKIIPFFNFPFFFWSNSQSLSSHAIMLSCNFHPFIYFPKIDTFAIRIFSTRQNNSLTRTHKHFRSKKNEYMQNTM